MKKDKVVDSFGKLKDGTFNFYFIEKYFLKKDKAETFQVISDKTCNDLDFQELFMFLDRTVSAIGQQYLYHQLRVIPQKPAITEQDESVISSFGNSPDLRTNVQKLLGKLKTVETYYLTTLFQDKHIDKPQWFWLLPVLSIANFISLVLLFLQPSFIFLFLTNTIVNLGIHYWNKRNLNQYLYSIPELIKMNSIAQKLNKMPLLNSLNPQLSSSIKILDQVSWRMSFFKLEANLQGDMGALFWVFFELIKILFLIEPILLFDILSRLDSRRKDIEEVYQYIGKIDLLFSIASLRGSKVDYCLPDFLNNKNSLVAHEVVHPLIPNCVSNSINLKDKSILLTGSNMSGKTSFIRTIGINVICGLTINTCFASYFAMPKMKIFSAIRISDDLLNDKSYYFEEVLTIKKMIDNSRNNDSPALFLLDEIFKGTNTIERISAGKAVLSALAKNNIVFVSTHDIELANLLKEYELYHFSEVIENEQVGFDYQLKPGKLKHRNAIRILQINGYPEEIITEAIRISENLNDPLSDNFPVR